MEHPDSRVPAATAAQLYASVSLPKFTVLWLCSLGLYGIYWFYKQWQGIKERERLDIIPALRAIFQIFFCYSLFEHVNASAKVHGVDGGIAAGALAAGFILLSVLWRLPDPYWLVSTLSFVFLLPAQHLMNRINSQVAPELPLNARFSAANIILVVFGGALYLLAVAGTLLPPEGQADLPETRPAPKRTPVVMVHGVRHA